MRRIVLSLLLLVQPSAPILCQTGNHKSDIDTYVDECRRIDMVLNARERHREPSDPIDPDDDFNVAQRGCAQLQSARFAAEESMRELWTVAVEADWRRSRVQTWLRCSRPLPNSAQSSQGLDCHPPLPKNSLKRWKRVQQVQAEWISSTSWTISPSVHIPPAT